LFWEKAHKIATKLVFGLFWILAMLVTITPLLRPLTGTTLYYLANDFVAEQLCEQKEIENNCCQGSCFLEKTVLNDTSNSETGNWLNRILSLKEIVLYFEDTYILSADVLESSINIAPITPKLNTSPGFCPSLLRPPQFLF